MPPEYLVISPHVSAMHLPHRYVDTCLYTSLLYCSSILFSQVFCFHIPCGSAGKESAYNEETWVQSLGWEDPSTRERLPTPVFWRGEFHVLYRPQGHKESDTTE